MPYRYARVEVGVAYDSSLTYPTFGPLKAFFDQSQDLQQSDSVVRILPGAAEALISLAPVTTGYFVCIFSDYPVMVRLNGNSNTQYTLKSNNAAATNVSSPLPDMCCFMMTGTITSLYLAPIASAAQTANVKIVCTGDPQSAYL